jgi:hypothetical protein
MVVPLIYELKKDGNIRPLSPFIQFLSRMLISLFPMIGFMARATGGFTEHTHSTPTAFKSPVARL